MGCCVVREEVDFLLAWIYDLHTLDSFLYVLAGVGSISAHVPSHSKLLTENLASTPLHTYCVILVHYIATVELGCVHLSS